MSRFDDWFTQRTRSLARRTSRRSFLTRFGTLLVGGAALPLLPVARGEEPHRERQDPREVEGQLDREDHRGQQAKVHGSPEHLSLEETRPHELHQVFLLVFCDAHPGVHDP